MEKTVDTHYPCYPESLDEQSIQAVGEFPIHEIGWLCCQQPMTTSLVWAHFSRTCRLVKWHLTQWLDSTPFWMWTFFMPVSNSIAVSTFCNLLELLNVPSDYSSLARLSTSVHCTETSAVSKGVLLGLLYLSVAKLGWS